jgi:hypothetical protein
MADVVTFDPSGPLRIVEIDTGGDSELEVREIYSEWKVWSALPGNLGYPPAFSVIGGEPTVPPQSVGTTHFLLDPWKIRPSERDHRLRLIGNLYTDDGTSPIVETLGEYTVAVEYEVSSLVVGLSDIEDWSDAEKAQFRDALGIDGTKNTATGGQLQVIGSDATSSNIADAVLDELLSEHTIVGSLGQVMAAAGVDAELCKKADYNRLAVNITAQELILYDDDDTILQRWPIKTVGGELVATVEGVQAERGTPIL